MGAVVERSVARSNLVIAVASALALLRCSLLVDTGGLVTPADASALSDTSANDAGEPPTSSNDAAFSSDVNGLKDVVIPNGAERWSVNGHGYLLVVDGVGVRWTDARDAAIALGGHLATITSVEENAFVYTVAKKDDVAWIEDDTKGPWLGGERTGGGGTSWAWVTGEPFTYTNWREGEPSAESDQNHLHFQGDLLGDSRWDNFRNLSGLNGYLVEFE